MSFYMYQIHILKKYADPHPGTFIGNNNLVALDFDA
jgi:hypothetical protein